MITLHNKGAWLIDGTALILDDMTREQSLGALAAAGLPGERLDAVEQTGAAETARRQTIAHTILAAHNVAGDETDLRIRFDAMASHDITYVGIVQTARASGLERFPVPYVLTNCHNSLCAVGGTINEDDHVFGLSAAHKYGGIYVPANQAVIHQYVREEMTGCGRMILGSDSHTRYGALGTMGVGEGGPELVKQLLSNTYDISAPDVVLVYLEGTPRRGVGPHDVAVALTGAVFASGFVKNKVLEFAGPGVAGLSVDFRNGIDVMTTETTCLSSIWTTDDKVAEYFRIHGRPDAYKRLAPGAVARYDAVVRVDLSAIEPMVALPFHPSNAVLVRDLADHPADILAAVEADTRAQFGPEVSLNLLDKLVDGRLVVDQGIIAGCAGGTFENICEAAAILRGQSVGDGYFSLSVYPASTPVNLAIARNGALADLLASGAVSKPAFCGPCFGAGDVPANNGLSIRHTTRNFPSREGSKPGQGQIAAVALMDARSIAATAANGGRLTPATDVDYQMPDLTYTFDRSPYDKRVYQGYGKPDPATELRFGPNIADWPRMYPLTDHLLLRLASVIRDPVTTTDELIPSGETSSYRSNPIRLAEFTLSRRDPAYVGQSKAVMQAEKTRREAFEQAGDPAAALPQDMLEALALAADALGMPADLLSRTALGSAIFANKPGDGSAREQAASCQRVLGGMANIARDYATKRYRSNCINWGILPFTIDADEPFSYESGDFVFVPDIRRAVEEGRSDIPAKVVSGEQVRDLLLHIAPLTPDEKTILLEGCLINYYAAQKRRS
jgi:aconitate hydratase